MSCMIPYIGAIATACTGFGVFIANAVLNSYIREAEARSRKAEVLSLEEKYKSDVEAFRQDIKDLHTEIRQRQQELSEIGGTIRNQMLETQDTDRDHISSLRGEMADLRIENCALRNKQHEQASEMAAIRKRQLDIDGHVEWVLKVTGGLVDIAKVGVKQVARVEAKLEYLEEEVRALHGDIINLGGGMAGSDGPAASGP